MTRARGETRTIIDSYAQAETLRESRLVNQPACTRENAATKWPPRTLSHLPLQVAGSQSRGAARARPTRHKTSLAYLLRSWPALPLNVSLSLSLRRSRGCRRRGVPRSLSLVRSRSFRQHFSLLRC